MSRVLIIGSHVPVSREIGDALCAASLHMEDWAGHADDLHRLRVRSFGVVITSADSAIEESLALLEEMRSIRPGVKCIVLAHHSTPDEVIAALRARVFACFTPPFDTHEIATLAARAASASNRSATPPSQIPLPIPPLTSHNAKKRECAPEDTASFSQAAPLTS